MMRWAAELFGSPFKICSAIAIASAGFLLNAILALAICGEEPAPLNIFLKKPEPPPPALRNCASRSALRHSKKPGSSFQHLVQQRDGVIQVFLRQRLRAAGEQGARVP